MRVYFEIPIGESETIEFKKSLGETKEIIQTIVAFANRSGGEIWVGIAPDGRREGVQIGKNTIENLTNQIKSNTNPPLYPEIFEHKINEKSLSLKILNGTLAQLIYRAMRFVKNNIRYSSEVGGLERYERWEYPLKAIKEAIVNAIVHRDYYSTANIQLAIYDDRFEIWNPGGLSGSLTLEGLRRSHQSIPRNQLIASLFFNIKEVERWGTGTILMIEETKKHKLPEPIFEERDGSFLVILRSRMRV